MDGKPLTIFFISKKVNGPLQVTRHLLSILVDYLVDGLPNASVLHLLHRCQLRVMEGLLSSLVSPPAPARAAASRVAREPELRTGVRSALGMPHAMPLTPPRLACRYHGLLRARAGAQAGLGFNGFFKARSPRPPHPPCVESTSLRRRLSMVPSLSAARSPVAFHCVSCLMRFCCVACTGW